MLPASRRRPRGVGPGRPRSERGTVRAAREHPGPKVAREPCARRPIARHEADRTGARDERTAPDGEPAGGTTTPFVRWTSGAFDSQGQPMTETDTKTATDPTAATDAAAGLPKAYRPGEVEDAVYERWIAADVFAPDGAGVSPDPDAEPFTIIQPPPNVTGSLHLGHAQRATVEDLMIRHARMQGRPTLFLPGLDHASIAAQFVLDRILAGEGESRQTLGRERYLERMNRVDEATGEPLPDQTLTVATTRPETILGDTAVAVHPADERYRGLVGRKVR